MHDFYVNSLISVYPGIGTESMTLSTFVRMVILLSQQQHCCTKLSTSCFTHIHLSIPLGAPPSPRSTCGPSSYRKNAITPATLAAKSQRSTVAAAQFRGDGASFFGTVRGVFGHFCMFDKSVQSGGGLTYIVE